MILYMVEPKSLLFLNVARAARNALNDISFARYAQKTIFI